MTGCLCTSSLVLNFVSWPLSLSFSARYVVTLASLFLFFFFLCVYSLVSYLLKLSMSVCVSVCLQLNATSAIRDLSRVIPVLSESLREHNESTVQVPIQLTLSMTAAKHVVQVHRSLTMCRSVVLCTFWCVFYIWWCNDDVIVEYQNVQWWCSGQPSFWCYSSWWWQRHGGITKLISWFFVRVLRASVLLVGTLGLDMSSVARLAVHLSGRQLLTIDTSKKGTFFDDLRSAYRQAVCEAKKCTIILQVILWNKMEVVPLYLSICVCVDIYICRKWPTLWPMCIDAEQIMHARLDWLCLHWLHADCVSSPVHINVIQLSK